MKVLSAMCQDEGMNSAEKEKLCINCEGRISLSAQVCPYCAFDQNESKTQKTFQTPIFQNQSLEDSLTSLYTPPYQGKKPQFDETQISSEEQQVDSPPIYKEVTRQAEIDPLIGATVEEEPVSPKSSLWPTLFLISGANFFILGLMQLFFSKSGILRLEWDANYWFFYCLFGGPLFYFGRKKLKNLED